MWQMHSLRSSEVWVQSLPILHKKSFKSVMLTEDMWPQDCSGCFKDFTNFPKAFSNDPLLSSA